MAPAKPRSARSSTSWLANSRSTPGHRPGTWAWAAWSSWQVGSIRLKGTLDGAMLLGAPWVGMRAPRGAEYEEECRERGAKVGAGASGVNRPVGATLHSGAETLAVCALSTSPSLSGITGSDRMNRRAALGRRLDAYGPVHDAQVFGHQGQTQSGAGSGATPPDAEPREAFEHLGPFLGVDARPGVVDRDLDLAS